MNETATLDVTQLFVKSLVEKLDKAEAQRNELLLALEELLDACPVGWGNNRRLNEAMVQAERAIDGARK